MKTPIFNKILHNYNFCTFDTLPHLSPLRFLCEFNPISTATIGPLPNLSLFPQTQTYDISKPTR